MKQHIYLIGFMGSGKSTISRKLGHRLHLPALEMDAMIVKEAGMSINEIFAQYGEAYFRDLETQVLQSIAASKPVVVSCGGGTALREENVKLMRESGKLILLGASSETIYQRVRNGKNRPILNGHMNVEYISELMEKRRPAYEAAAEITVATDGKTPDEIADEIVKIMGLSN